MPMIVVPDSSMESLRELVATLASTTELVGGCFIKRRLRDQLCSIGKDRYSDITLRASCRPFPRASITITTFTCICKTRVLLKSVAFKH